MRPYFSLARAVSGTTATMGSFYNDQNNEIFLITSCKHTRPRASAHKQQFEALQCITRSHVQTVILTQTQWGGQYQSPLSLSLRCLSVCRQLILFVYVPTFIAQLSFRSFFFLCLQFLSFLCSILCSDSCTRVVEVKYFGPVNVKSCGTVDVVRWHSVRIVYIVDKSHRKMS